MATTNRLYIWKDGNRLFVDLNGATIEAQSLRFDEQIVTLQFEARRMVLKKTASPSGSTMPVRTATESAIQDDFLLDESLW